MFQMTQVIKDTGALFKASWKTLLPMWLGAFLLTLLYSRLMSWLNALGLFEYLWDTNLLLYFAAIWLRNSFYSIVSATIVVGLYRIVGGRSSLKGETWKDILKVFPLIYAADLIHMFVVYVGYFADSEWGPDIHFMFRGLTPESFGPNLWISFYLFLLPGAIVQFLTMFYPQLIVFLGRGTWSAIKTSFRLVIPHWGKALIAFLLIGLHELPIRVVSHFLPGGPGAYFIDLTFFCALALVGYAFATVLFLHLLSLHRNNPPAEVTCPACKAILELEDSEQRSGYADCPNCARHFPWQVV
jgi:hypothetical protein